VRVRYAETDRMGVVYYANYLVWFEIGRTDLIRALGRTYRELEDDGVILPVIEVHCEYRQSARYDDEIEIRTRGAVLSPVRMKFEYEVVRRDDSMVIASGHTVHASLDLQGKPRRLPEMLRREFS
jgi:acyl-CoA thioester hydrolase